VNDQASMTKSFLCFVMFNPKNPKKMKNISESKRMRRLMGEKEKKKISHNFQVFVFFHLMGIKRIYNNSDMQAGANRNFPPNFF
jgi:hypothetical protein